MEPGRASTLAKGVGARYPTSNWTPSFLRTRPRSRCSSS